MAVECCYCHRWDSETKVSHIHEVLITRGDVQKMAEDQRVAIHSPWNCALVHPRCHPMAEGREGTILAIQYLIRYEGYSQINRWLMSLSGLEFPQRMLMEKSALLIDAFDRMWADNV